MKKELKELVGIKLKECRQSQHLTQQEVANMLGVAQPVYQRFEKGIYECSYSQLVKLADIFDTSVDYILCRKDYD